MQPSGVETLCPITIPNRSFNPRSGLIKSQVMMNANSATAMTPVSCAVN